jgi:hypothetical protein
MKEQEMIMTYHGHVRKGVILLNEPASLPDGTVVSIRPLKKSFTRAKDEVRSTPNAGFWTSPTAAELAEQQQVVFPENVEALAGDWPEDESIDEFLEVVRRNRA